MSKEPDPTIEYFHQDLRLYRIEMDAFGVLGAPALRDLSAATTKAERRQALRRISNLLQTYNVINPFDIVEYISIGCNINGRQFLLITCRYHPAPTEGAM